MPSSSSSSLARLSSGCLGWALSVAADERLLEQRAERITSLVGMADSGYEERFAYVAQLAAESQKNGGRFGETLELWLVWWRDLLLVKGGCLEAITNIDHQATLFRLADGYSLEQVKGFIDCLQAAQQQLEHNANPRLVLEVLMLNLPRK